MKNITCIVCPNGCEISVEGKEGDWKISGNACPKGRVFAINEMTNPLRSICSTVRTTFEDYPRLPVRTDREVPKERIFEIMDQINKVIIDNPVHSGDIIIENVLNTGVNIISESDMFLIMDMEG